MMDAKLEKIQTIAEELLELGLELSISVMPGREETKAALGFPVLEVHLLDDPGKGMMKELEKQNGKTESVHPDMGCKFIGTHTQCSHGRVNWTRVEELEGSHEQAD